MVAFRGVIVNDVENHFDAGGVKVAHHGFELVSPARRSTPLEEYLQSGAKKPIVL